MATSIGIGIGLPFQRRRADFIITAIIFPVIGEIRDGDEIEQHLSDNIDQLSNYESTKGNITAVTLNVFVNGNPAQVTDTVSLNDVVSLEVEVSDDANNSRTFLDSRIVAGIVPENITPAVVSGDTALGDTLTVAAGDWGGVPVPTLTYQWRRDGVDIPGETGTTYEIQLADSDKFIDVVETATNVEGSASEASNAIKVDEFTVPINTTPAVISGDTTLGDTLTITSAGVWTDGSAPPLGSPSYQWRRNGVDLPGETGTTYEIKLADSDAFIDVVETISNVIGAASEASNAIEVDEFTVPGTFGEADWELDNDEGNILLIINNLPSDGSVGIDAIEYRINQGAAVGLGVVGTGTFPISGAVEGDDVELRAVNIIGAGDWSDVKEVPDEFDPTYIIEIDTEQSGTSGSDQFQFTGAVGEYDVDAVQGGTVVATFTGLVNEETITLPAPGVYELHIKLEEGNFFDKFRFARSGDKDKLLRTLQWGDYGVNEDDQDSAFDICENHSEIAGSGKWFDVVTDGERMFLSNSLTSLPEGMELPLLTNGLNMFRLNSLTSLPEGMELPLLTNGLNMFRDNNLTSLPEKMTLPLLENGERIFDENNLTSLPEEMYLPSLTNGDRMFDGNTLSTETLSRLYCGMSEKNPNSNVEFHGGSGNYDPSLNFVIDGVTVNTGDARQDLVNRGWSITDGGAI